MVKSKKLIEKLNDYGINTKFIKKDNLVWIPLYNNDMDDDVDIIQKNINYNSITKQDKQKIDETILHIIRNRYTFISNNGLPREIKIEKYFDLEESSLVLFNYNEILKTELVFANFTDSFDLFLGHLESFNLVPSILSGGDELEILNFLKKKNYLHRFKRIMGGPTTKFNNINSINLFEKCLFIGDSKIDYEVAKKFNLDFIFMYGYTQFSSWENFFEKNKIIRCIKDFSELLSNINHSKRS